MTKKEHNLEDKINDTFKGSLNIFKKKYVTLIIGTIIALIGSIFVITFPPLLFGVYVMAVKAERGEEIEIKDVFKGFDYIIRSWVMFIVGFLAIVIGLVFLVLPGVLLMILFQYAIPIAISENTGAIDSLKKSFRVGKDNFTFTLVIWLFLLIIGVVGSRIPLLGLLTFPFTLLVTTVAYKRISK